jgi:type VI protein secretion system component VasF
MSRARNEEPISELQDGTRSSERELVFMRPIEVAAAILLAVLVVLLFLV